MKYLILLSLLFVLPSCAPVSDAVNEAINAVGRGEDGATMVLTDTSLTFNPADSSAYDVEIYAGGENVTESDPRCEPYRNGVTCSPPEVIDEPTAFAVQHATSANVSFFRSAEGDDFRFFYVRSE